MFVISYFDSISGSRAAGWPKGSSFRLSEELLAIKNMFGDTTHTSGRADYLVRFFEDFADKTVQEDIPNYFLVGAEVDGVDVIERVGEEARQTTAHFSYEEDWFEGVRTRFIAFRKRLG